MTQTYLGHSWRARWRGLVVLTLIVALAGGAVVAALAGARRSASALDRFHEAAQTHDVFLAGEITGPEPSALHDLLDGPLVESTNDLAFLFVDDAATGLMFAPTSRRGLDVERGVLVEGRRADPDEPDEVVMSEAAAKALGVGVGDTIEAGSLDQPQADAMLATGDLPGTPAGPLLRLDVVGIVRNGFSLVGGGTPLTLTTPAFWETYGDEIGIGARSHMIRLVDQPDAVDRFTDAVEDAYGNDHLPSINLARGEEPIADSIAVITAAVLAVALVVGIAGAVWIALAMARHQRDAVHEIDVLRALGASVGQERGLLVGSVLPAVVAGLVLGPLVAVALSPLFPVGTARRVDPDPGLHVDSVALIAGGAVVAVVLVTIAVLAAARMVRRDRPVDRNEPRAPRLADRLARWLQPAPATGVRFALHTPPRSSAPVRSALAGALVGVVALVAVAVVGAGLRRLVDTPARWGTTWDVAIARQAFLPEGVDPSDETSASAAVREALVAAPDIAEAAMAVYDEQLTIDGVEAISMTFDPVKGGIAPTVVAGREPRADDEIALGRDTLRDVGVELGATVTVGSRHQRSGEYRVVGVIVFPTIGEPTEVATGATLTGRGGERLLLGDESGGDDVGTKYVVVRWAPGVDHDDALIRRGIEDAGSSTIEVSAAGPTQPPNVTGLEDVQGFPLVVGAGLVVIGLLATGHALLVTVRRRRLDLGVLSALGFAPGQRGVAIHGQASTIALVAIVVGVPLGLVAGRLLWSAISGSLGLATDASFPLAVLAAGAVGLVVALNLVAAWPAWTARRLRVADALRSE
jgi:ABC-type lipoprotein release transport system permease subunit